MTAQKPTKIPTKALLELYLAVADFADGDHCDGGRFRDEPTVPSYLRKAYNRVFRTAWGRRQYSDAVEANARL